MQRPLEIYERNVRILEDYLYQWGQSQNVDKLREAFETGNERDMIRVANNAWLDLPDRPAIREHGFFILCDIAEYIFE